MAVPMGEHYLGSLRAYISACDRAGLELCTLDLAWVNDCFALIDTQAEEIAKLRAIVEGLSARIAAQSELLARKSERLV